VVACQPIAAFGGTATGRFWDGFKKVNQVPMPHGWSTFRARYRLSADATGQMYVAHSVMDSAGTVLQFSLQQTAELLSPGGMHEVEWSTYTADSRNAAHYLGVYLRGADVTYSTGNGTVEIYEWTGDCTYPAYCEYGTRLKPDQATNLVVTAGVVTAIAAVVPQARWLSIVFDVLIGASFNANIVCQGPPPDVPTFTADDFIGGTPVPNPSSIGKVWQAFNALAWSIYCECVPAGSGQPAPSTPPAPTVPAPPDGIPTDAPNLVCDIDDLCSQFNQLLRAVAATNAQIRLLRQDVTLIQRQAVPFAYLPGTVHSGLSGQGTIPVSGILGLSVSFSTVPAYLSADMDGAARSTYYLGHVNVGDPYGWERRRAITHDPMLLLDLPPSSTIVEYNFQPGCVASITELIREP